MVFCHFFYTFSFMKRAVGTSAKQSKITKLLVLVDHYNWFTHSPVTDNFKNTSTQNMSLKFGMHLICIPVSPGIGIHHTFPPILDTGVEKGNLQLLNMNPFFILDLAVSNFE